MYNLKRGDCLELMKELPDNSVDFVLCDLPYGMTDCKWDIALPMEELWDAYRRIVKPSGTIALFCIQPFTTNLIASNIKNFRFMWYWKKNNVTGGPFCKVQPMRCIEDIAVFSPTSCEDNRGKHLNLRAYFWEELKKSGLKRADMGRILNSSMASHYFTNGRQFAIPSEENYAKLQVAAPGCFLRPYEDIYKEYGLESGCTSQKKLSRYTYNPQGLRPAKNKRIRGRVTPSVYRHQIQTKPQEFEGYPNHLLCFPNEVASNIGRLHPTQKPVKLLEYLIKTHTNPGETVLDNTMGSGSTGVACVNTGRNFIGFEMNEKYFDIASRRIAEAEQVANDNENLDFSMETHEIDNETNSQLELPDTILPNQEMKHVTV